MKNLNEVQKLELEKLTTKAEKIIYLGSEKFSHKEIVELVDTKISSITYYIHRNGTPTGKTSKGTGKSKLTPSQEITKLELEIAERQTRVSYLKEIQERETQTKMNEAMETLAQSNPNINVEALEKFLATQA